MGRSKDQRSEKDGSGSKKMARSSPELGRDENSERQRKAQLESKVRERVASEARAFDVVNRLIEPNITVDYLQQACQFIDESHYADVVEERSISHLCGYPLCSSALLQMSKQKYHISTKSNTVYDITERKKFCSNRCYHCSEHLRKQIPQTPVWTRKGEDFHLFDLLQPNITSPLEGELVISSHLFGLKEEVQLLEKLDRMEVKPTDRIHRTSSSSAASDAQHGRLLLEESQRLSRQLLSLSTEEDLGMGMEKLSLAEDRELDRREPSEGKEPSDKREHSNRNEPSNHRLGGGNNPSSKKEEQFQSGGEAKVLQGQVIVTACKDKWRSPCGKADKDVESTDVNSGLEISLSGLTVQDSGDANRVPSYEEDKVHSSDVELHENQPSGGSGNMQESDVSKAQPVQLHAVSIDSDDEEGTVHGSDVSVGTVKESDNQSKPQSSLASKTCATDSLNPVALNRQTGDAESGGDSLHEERPRVDPLQQQPGESKVAYLMQLLDRRKHLLSRVADIQSGVSPTSEKTDGSACSSGTKSTEEEPKSPESDKEDVYKENFLRNSSEQLKQGKEKTQDSKASHQARKKKSLQPHNPPAITMTAQSHTSPLSAICQVIASWVTAETLDYLVLNSSTGGQEEDLESSPSKFLRDPNMQQKYQDLCQHLTDQERDFDAMLGEDDFEADGGRLGEKKPLPNYEELKKEMKDYKQRVQQFMAGAMTIPSKPTKAKAEGHDGDKAESERPVMLPAIDSHNQLLIRRRIVLERLERTMPSMLPPLGLSVQDVWAPLRELVFTFSLSSHNIVFKPAEWNLAAIILLKMVEGKISAVKTSFESPDRSSAFSMVLSHLGHSTASLGQLVKSMLAQRSQQLVASGTKERQSVIEQ